METNQAKNKALIDRLPFLMPRNRWTDKIPENFDYSYTELDAMPDGWRKAFGEQMCEEIRAELVRVDYLGKYRITQIKEKYGSLRWYDLGCTERMLHEIIPKYESLSARICIQCGAPATKISTGWISPYCDACAEKIGRYEQFVPIDVFYESEQRKFENHRIVKVLPKVRDGLAWVLEGEGTATIKWDGSCCAVMDGIFYRRYDAKHGKPVPPNAIRCQEEADPVTGHLPCWIPCDRTAPDDKWFWAAFDGMDMSPMEHMKPWGHISK